MDWTNVPIFYRCIPGIKLAESIYGPYVSRARARIIALVATCSLDSRHPGSEVTAIRNAVTPDSRHLRASYKTP